MTAPDSAPVPSTAWNKTEVHPGIRSAPTNAFHDYTTPDFAIERALARFLAHPEDAEATWLPKPGMEREWLTTDHGACHWCGATGPRWRYELHKGHVDYLNCPHEDDYGAGCWICLPCYTPIHGGPGIDRNEVDCAALDCRWEDWLRHGRMPWLCGWCWKTTTTLEAEHVAYLKAEY
jgi:hypothetical protein